MVNLYGQSADLDPIMEICRGYGVPVIEDAAESLGAVYRGKASGTLGKFGVFSFNGNKIITTSGGGMLVGDDLQVLEKVRFLATQARDRARHYEHSEMGYNYRLSGVLAAIGRGNCRCWSSGWRRGGLFSGVMLRRWGMLTGLISCRRLLMVAVRAG